MRKVLALTLVLTFAFVAIAFAEIKLTGERPVQPWKHRHTYEDLYYPDTNTQRQAFGYGVGLDAVLWEAQKERSLLDEIFIEGRYDIKNRESRVYAVGKVKFNTFWQ